MNNAEYIIKTLEQEKIDYFFMVPGKLINPIMSCYKKGTTHTFKTHPIVAAHEAGAVAMADGYARASHKFGVTVVIDGPGVMNAVSFLAAAQADSSSVMLLSGQIPRDFQMLGAIQDTSQSGINTSAMLKHVCDTSYNLNNKESFHRYFSTTIRRMKCPSKSTSFLSIAKDLFLEEASQEPKRVIQSWDNPELGDMRAIKDFIDVDLNRTHKILLLVGPHASSSEFKNTLEKISATYNIPVTTTINSKGLFNEKLEQYLGLFGYAGHKPAQDAILTHDAEIIIMVGFHATQWSTLAWHEDFISHPCIVQVDKDQTQICRYVPVYKGIISDEVLFLKTLLDQACDILENGKDLRGKWIKSLKKDGFFYNDIQSLMEKTIIHPAQIIIDAQKVFHKNTLVVADAGVHRSYAAHYWMCGQDSAFYAATTFAPMGWAVPASIGIKLAKPNHPLVVFTGDGCMLMSGFEIQTAAKLGLDITYVVFNNGHYGASYFNNIQNEPYLTKIPHHNWAKVAEAFGLTAYSVDGHDQLIPTFQKCLETPGTKLVDVKCDHEARAPSPIYAETLKSYGVM